jgi:ligand-binding sensor domain-containing protein/two-component sensor histidine kinase
MPRKITHTIRFLCCLACCWWILPVCTYSQINSWNHYLYTTKDGLPTNFVKNVVQDHDGFIWIATDFGLCRFDGDEILRINHDANDSTSIPTDLITHVALMPDGRLLVGTDDGLFVMNTHTMKGHTMQFNTQKGWEFYDDYIDYISVNTALEKVFVLTGTAFNIFDFNLSHIETIPYKFSSDDVSNAGLFSYKCLFLPNGDAFFIDVFSRKFGLFDYNSKKILPLSEAINNPYSALVACYKSDCLGMDKSGNIWVHNEGIDTLFCCQHNRKLIGYPLKGDYKNVAWSSQIFFPDEQHMIMSFEIDGKTQLCELPYAALIKNPGVEISLKSKSGFDAELYELYPDRDKNWWIASSEGLHLLKKNYTDFQRIELPLPYEYNSNWQHVSDIIRVDKNHLLFTTYLQHCYLYNIGQNTMVSYLDTVSLANALYFRMNKVYDIASSRFLIHGNQDFTFQKKQLIKGFLPTNKLEQQFKQFSPLAYLKDSKNNTWVSFEDHGLVRWDAVSDSIYFYPPGENFISNVFTDITEDANGDLWFVTPYQPTLSKFNSSTRQFETLKLNSISKLKLSYINGIEAGNDDWLFMSAKNALIMYNTRDKSLKKITIKDGLPSGVIHGLYYHDHHLFISTSTGLAIMNIDHFYMKILKQEDGIKEGVTTGAFYIDSQANTLYLGGNGGVYKIALASLLKNENPTNVVINNVRLDNGLVEFFSNDIKLKPSQNNISFSVSSIDFYSGINKKYFYRIILNGKPSEWISNQHNKQFSFINLSSGDYTIEVRSKNADNAWSVNTAAISFTILKPWYNQGWFYALCLLTTGFVLLTVYNYRIRQIRSVERIRSKLSRDLHDDIGSTLSSINILSQMAKHNAPESSDSKTTDALEKINERSQRLLDNMSDIVWSIKPENDTLDEMLIRMRQYATGMLESKGIDYTIDFPIEKTDFKLPLEVKNNIYLIFKEAVNNLCKYAQCRQVNLTLRIENKKMKLVIQDDGIGFMTDDKANGTGGNGLKNMRKRAAEIKADLFIDSSSGKGTSVSLLYRLL